MSRAAWIAILVAVVVVAGALAVTNAGWFGSGAQRATTRPKLATQVASSLPPEGVSIDGQVLKPWTSTPRDAMSTQNAIKAARRYSDKGYPATALRATLRRTPVWVVTFTSPKPVDVGTVASVYVTHFSVAINAVTGKFERGFFER